MACWPVVGASVETFGILVVPTLTASPGSLTGAVPEALLGTEASGVRTVAALVNTTKSPLLAVAAGVMVLGWPGVAAAGVAPFTTVRAAPEMLVVGAAGLSVTVGACGWVGTGWTVGLDVAVTATAGVMIAAVGFAGVGASVGLVCLPASSVGGAPVAPPVVGLLPVVTANDCTFPDVLPRVGTTTTAGVTEAASFDTEVAL